MISSWSSAAVRPGPAVETEGGAELAELGGAEHAADQVLAVVADEAADPHALVGQPVPDGEQQARDQPEAGLAVRGQARDLGVPEGAPFVAVRSPPVGGVEGGLRDGLARGGTDKAHALLHVAVVERARGRVHDQCRALWTGR